MTRHNNQTLRLMPKRNKKRRMPIEVCFEGAYDPHTECVLKFHMLRTQVCFEGAVPRTPIYFADAADDDCSSRQICEREATRAGMQADVTKNGDTDPARGLWSPFGMRDVLIKVLLA